MTIHHHRTVDRITRALEITARAHDGISLTDIAAELGAPKSSVQQLLSGLVATGYLKMRGRHYVLGPSAHLLSVMSGRRAQYSRIDHEDLVRLSQRVERSVYLGALFGDSCVSVDQVGLNSMADFAAWDYARRPLFSSASGKAILAHVSAADLRELAAAQSRVDQGVVDAFFSELSSIRASGLAYNLGSTYPDVFAVATPVHDSKGEFVAAATVVGSPDDRDTLSDLGQTLKAEVATWTLA
jgi:DNA-binding IclR family transcriptional regulator